MRGLSHQHFYLVLLFSSSWALSTFWGCFLFVLASDGSAVDRKAFSRREESMNSNNGRNNTTKRKILKNIKRRKGKMLLFYFC